MNIRRLLVAFLIAAFLATGIPNPPEARANNTAAIIAGAVVGWFALVAAATYYIRTHNTSFGQSSASPLVPGEQFALRPEEPSQLHFGEKCGRLAEGPSLVCW